MVGLFYPIIAVYYYKQKTRIRNFQTVYGFADSLSGTTVIYRDPCLFRMTRTNFWPKTLDLPHGAFLVSQGISN